MLCCTAEILANMALREGAATDVGQVGIHLGRCEHDDGTVCWHIAIALAHGCGRKPPITESDGYWLAQRPLTLVVSMGRKTWRWQGVEIAGDSRLIVTGSGKPEVR